MESTVSLKHSRDEEYQTKFFGFCSREVFDGVIERIVPDGIVNSTQSLKACLVQNFKKEIQLKQTETATLDLTKETKAAAAEPLVQLKVLLDKCFDIPSNVLLPEDLVQCHQYEKESENIDQELKELKNRAMVGCFMEKFLEDEYNMINNFEGAVNDKFMLKNTENLLSQQSNNNFESHNLPSKIIKLAQDAKDIEKVQQKYVKDNKESDDVCDGNVKNYWSSVK